MKNAILLILATSLILTTLAACQNTAADKSRVETTTVMATTEPATVEQTNEPETTTVVTTTAKPPIPHKRSTKNIDPFLELQIREDYLKFRKAVAPNSEWVQKTTLDDVWVEKYFGSFSFGNVVILDGKFFGAYMDVVSVIRIAGYDFVIPASGIQIILYQNSNFYNIEKAYETGIITKENVSEIYYAYYPDKKK